MEEEGLRGSSEPPFICMYKQAGWDYVGIRGSFEFGEKLGYLMYMW